MSEQNLKQKLLALNLANENVATVLLDLGNFEALIDVLCQQRAALEDYVQAPPGEYYSKANDHTVIFSPDTAVDALAATDEALKRMGCEI